MHTQPVPIHAKDLRANGKMSLRPVLIHWEEFGVNKREEFNLVGEVEVTLKLEYKGSTVGAFNPPRGLGSEIRVQPQALLNVARTITLGPGVKSESKQTDSVSRTFAPKSLLYSATFTAERSKEQ